MSTPELDSSSGGFEISFEVGLQLFCRLRLLRVGECNQLSLLLLLGGSWDVVTTYNWPHSPTNSLPKWPYIGNLNDE